MGSSAKVLGLGWNAGNDTLQMFIKQSKSASKFTIRTILTTLAEIWDPLGFLCGVTMVGNLILQSVVRMKRESDDLIPDEDLETRWEHWVEELEKCGDLIVSRSILPNKSFKSEPNYEVMGFSDGRSVAYGCAVYSRWFDKQESIIDVKFIEAK